MIHDQWWDAVIPSRLQEAPARLDLTFVLLSCGALVSDRQKLRTLQKRAEACVISDISDSYHLG